MTPVTPGEPGAGAGAGAGARAGAGEPGAGAGRRPVVASVLVGLVVGVAAGAAALGMVALPLLFFARAVDPGQALDRPLVRIGLLAVALPLGGVVATVGTVAAALWYRRGGQLPREEHASPGG